MGRYALSCRFWQTPGQLNYLLPVSHPSFPFALHCVYLDKGEMPQNLVKILKYLVLTPGKCVIFFEKANGRASTVGGDYGDPKLLNKFDCVSLSIKFHQYGIFLKLEEFTS